MRAHIDACRSGLGLLSVLFPSLKRSSSAAVSVPVQPRPSRSSAGRLPIVARLDGSGLVRVCLCASGNAILFSVFGKPDGRTRSALLLCALLGVLCVFAVCSRGADVFSSAPPSPGVCHLREAAQVCGGWEGSGCWGLCLRLSSERAWLVVLSRSAPGDVSRW